MKADQPKPIITTNDSMMVNERLRQPLIVKKTKIAKDQDEKSWIKHFKSLERRGKLTKVGPLFLNKV
jgi:hypothetical protein